MTTPAPDDMAPGVGIHALRAMRDGVVVVTPEGRVGFANAAAQELLGLPAAALAAGTTRDPAHGAVAADGSPIAPEDLPSAETLRTGREVFRRPIGIVRDGALRWLEVTTTILPADEGVLSTFIDTTERQEEARALQLAEERFRRTFDDGPIGKALVGLDGSWLRVNTRLVELLGYPEADLLARTFQDITHPDDLDADVGLMREVVEGHRDTYEIEKRYLRSDGQQLWALLSVALVRDDTGTPLHFVSQIQDISQRKRFESDLTHLADHDALTGLRNRRRFEADVAAEIARVGRLGAPSALIMLDLDRFKEVNDSLGHRVGDDLLRHVATILGGRLRRTDVLARLGGDEFAVLLPETPLEEAEAVARELVDRISRSPLAVGGRCDEVRVTASAGVAPVQPIFTTADEAMVAADLAMYEAKGAGRNMVHLRSPDDDREAHARERLCWSQRIRRALDEDGFVLHYQPIADLHTGRVDAFEALLRLRGAPGEPLVPPGRFLDIAARHGMMPAIDRWVVTTAISTLAAGELGPDALLSINISGLGLGDSRLADLVEQRVRVEQLDASRLQFEITETTAVASLEQAERFCRRMHRIGARLALDDFGSGFASFLNLKHLPFDTIKVDGEFVRTAARGPQERLMVEALLDVGRRLSKHTVAEFVEDQATHDLLRELGADAAQGYLIGRPGPAADAMRAAAAYDRRQLLAGCRPPQQTA